MCNICGALIGDIDIHADWHKEQAAPKPPATPADPWDDEVAAIVLGDTEGHWDQLFDHAARHILTCMWEQGRSDKVYRLHLVHAAARVRAMAPEGTEWDAPQPTEPGLERSVLRTVLRVLNKADNCHEAAHVNTVPSLLMADALLHGLYLAVGKET
jgi:hypothetical protein